tara:strand:+ start:297 stop:761 length:465 start_codon:yes stop_codon:yes gene_type:complete
MPSGIFLIGTNPTMTTFSKYILPNLKEMKWETEDIRSIPYDGNWQLAIALSGKKWFGQQNETTISSDLSDAIKKGFIDAIEGLNPEEILEERLVEILDIDAHNRGDRYLSNYQANFRTVETYPRRSGLITHFEHYVNKRTREENRIRESRSQTL